MSKEIFIKNSVFILSHQDDEIGIFEPLRLALKNKENVIVFYMTSGSIIKEISKNRLFHRDQESLSVLKKFGVKNKNIIFFGRINNIPTCRLYRKMDIAYIQLLKYLKKCDGKIKLYTHAWEGGNEDHDACNILIKKILHKLKNVDKAYQFSLYNADANFFYYQVQKIFRKNGKVYKIKTAFINRLKYITYLFYYTSQIKVWIGLYPFIITNLLFNRFYVLQNLNNNLKFQRPHQGKLLYEKFKRCEYPEFKKIIKIFLKKN